MLRTQALHALTEYELGSYQLGRVRTVTNTLLPVETKTGRFMLRLSAPNQRSDVGTRSELTWLAALRQDTDLIVPEPIPGRDGRLLVSVPASGDQPARAAVLFRWINGRPIPEPISARTAGMAGETLGRLHQHAIGFKPPASFSRERLDQAWTFGVPAVIAGRRPHPDWPAARRRLLRTAGDRVQAWIDALGAGGARRRFLHLDFHPGNWLRVDGQLAVLDFDDSQWAYPLQDLGYALYYLHDEDNEQATIPAFLNGYRRVCPDAAWTPNDIRLGILARQLDLVSFVYAQDALTGQALSKWLAAVERRITRLMKEDTYAFTALS